MTLATLESALFAKALWQFVVGTLAGGVAAGFIFRGGLSEPNRLAQPQHRTAVVSTFFVAAYVGLGLPAVLTGLISLPLGPVDASALVSGLAAAAVALAFVVVLHGLAPRPPHGPPRAPASAGAPRRSRSEFPTRAEHHLVFLRARITPLVASTVSTRTGAAVLRLPASACGSRHDVSRMECPRFRSMKNSALQKPVVSASRGTAVSPMTSMVSSTADAERGLQLEHRHGVALDGDGPGGPPDRPSAVGHDRVRADPQRVTRDPERFEDGQSQLRVDLQGQAQLARWFSTSGRTSFSMNVTESPSRACGAPEVCSEL